ncbi:MAG: hypoxanthine phosphoribosyltransferase [Bdellovibrionales bacterium RIFOXYC1_FULL_54_43]|nr:MAG: hypoxanthine phosphoribosyltransferase [Bdellovibrionales bacterium RIFOXYC1_FULL_54_43]OFZ82031.1 MAG: hypoxanthine phosphoribosyltransferase [Bdellovibrionales bacterium RIFOXYD1_FULL_55_31]HLD99087.1 hypoxanthine phosphoribosyltransferase [Bdellovibrionota bacterium]
MSEHRNKQPKVLIPEVKLQARLAELAQEISHDYRDREVTAICLLKGSFVFFSDLIRRLDVPMTCEFLGVSSYGNRMVSSGEVKITLDINEPLENKHVLIFDDIVDTGLTLSYIMNSLRARNPATLKSCSLLMKPDSLKVDIEPDYVGFKIGGEFVVGYGIDFAGQFRGLPYIGYIEHGH